MILNQLMKSKFIQPLVKSGCPQILQVISISF